MVVPNGLSSETLLAGLRQRVEDLGGIINNSKEAEIALNNVKERNVAAAFIPNENTGSFILVLRPDATSSYLSLEFCS